MKTTIARLARLVDGKISSSLDGRNIIITGFSGIREAGPGDVTFLANNRYISLLRETRASAIILPPGTKTPNHLAVIRTGNPDLAFARIVQHFSPKPASRPKGIHPKAVIGKNIKLGKNVSIQAYAVIQNNSRISNNTTIYPYVYIGEGAHVGRNCCIYPNVVISERTIIGNNVIIHAGSVIGSDGFGYATVKGVHHKIPQTGIVEIEDDVEIGANVTVDRARFGKTLIKKGAKIDNLVQIAHNVVVGAHSILVAQTGISGSTQLGNNVTMAGQSGAVGHVKIGDRVMVAGRSVVTKDVPPNMVVSGFPARAHKKQLKEQALISKLPQLVKSLKELETAVHKLGRERTKSKR